ncbi:MAG: YcaQ family DNA glycosylase [Anaerolineae bacterium]|nr:YcaQ family DNA glycosylase [Anaerolineae bacterium]
MNRELTLQSVRRLAISRQHLDGRSSPSMLDLIRDLGCLQLDPISVVERPHYLIPWSRLGNYDRADLDRLLWEEKTLFEYWAHAASIVLTEEYPIHQWNMRHASDARFEAYIHSRLNGDVDVPALTQTILARLARDKAVFSREISDGIENPDPDTAWYSGRYVPRILDHLWTKGDAMIVGRQGKQRQWGLTADFLPDWAPREEWNDAQVCRFAVQKAVRALGVATPKQVKWHYTRHRYPNLPQTIKQLTKEGGLIPVSVRGKDGNLPDTWYLHRDDLPLLEQIEQGNWQGRTTLLSPFDNLICDRDRTELLFDFRFRIEIYVPAAKREFGYYVLPILYGDDLIGRIDMNMDRKKGVLAAQTVYAEENAPDGEEVVTAVRQSVHDLAQFLAADKVDWGTMPSQWQELKG